MKPTKHEHYFKGNGGDEVGFVAINEIESIEFEPLKRVAKLPVIGSTLTIKGKKAGRHRGAWTVMATHANGAGKATIKLQRPFKSGSTKL